MLPLNSLTAAYLKFMKAFEIASGATEPSKMPWRVEKPRQVCVSNTLAPEENILSNMSCFVSKRIPVASC